MEDILFDKKPLKQHKTKNKTGSKEKSQVDLLWEFNAWLDLRWLDPVFFGGEGGTILLWSSLVSPPLLLS